MSQNLKSKLALGLKSLSSPSKNSDDSVNEIMDRLPSLTVDSSRAKTNVQKEHARKQSTGSSDEALEFVDVVSPVQRIRRKSSIVRKFSVGSLADSVTIELGEEKVEKEQVVFNSGSLFAPKISDFESVKVLGQGAYGKVLLVKHRTSGKLFAQKQLKKASILVAPSTQMSEKKLTEQELVNKNVERTMAERDILAKIEHPFIVKLFYALQDFNKIYLYLEYVPGGELFHYLSVTGFLDEKTASFYAAEMSLALLHLHKLGVVYRDLKPENCLLDQNGHLILTDFGLSKISTEQSSKCTSIIGTPEYMAPEVLKGEDYSFPVDWWSLGTVIYDMLSGKPPFTGDDTRSITNKIIKNKVKFPFYFTMDSKDILSKLLNKQPAKRMKVDQEFEKFKKHRFFRKVEWKLLENENEYMNSIPPIVPSISDPALAENFDDEFTQMKISNYDLDQASPVDVAHDYDEKIFEGFSYTASGSYIEKFLK